MSLTPCPARVGFGAGCHDAQPLENHATPVPGLLSKIQGKVDQVPIDEAAQAYIQKTSIVGLSLTSITSKNAEAERASKVSSGQSDKKRSPDEAN